MTAGLLCSTRTACVPRSARGQRYPHQAARDAPVHLMVSWDESTPTTQGSGAQLAHLPHGHFNLPALLSWPHCRCERLSRGKVSVLKLCGCTGASAFFGVSPLLGLPSHVLDSIPTLYPACEFHTFIISDCSGPLSPATAFARVLAPERKGGFRSTT